MALITSSSVVLRKATTVKMFFHALLCVAWKLLAVLLLHLRALDAIAGTPPTSREHSVFIATQTP